jgi:hypothetical protein
MGMTRMLGLALVALVTTGAEAAPAEAAASANGDGGAPAFRLEGKSAIDDVFGDTADYRRTIDRFLELTTTMQSLREEFARTAQQILTELGRQPDGKLAHARTCPVDGVAAPYARAHHLGAEYLRTGRELVRHHEQIREYDRLGESVGLTPDYRWKVRKVLAQYNALLVDYREMKMAFHDQLNDELKFLGCDLGALLLKGDPGLHPVATASATAPAPPPPPDEPWPQPGAPGAPGVPLVHTAVPDREPHETPPTTLPAERVPALQPIPLPRRPDSEEQRAPRSGVLFYVDNSRCSRGTSVFLDGRRIGDVAGAQRVGFQAVPGPHDLCLLDDAKKQCGAPGTVRRSYLHEGWTISLRCE